MDGFGPARVELDGYLERVQRLNARYRAGEIHVHVPAELEQDQPLDDLVRRFLPASHAALAAAARSLFFSLPVAFDPAHSVGSLPRHGRSRSGRGALPLHRHGRADRHPGASARTIPRSWRRCCATCPSRSRATRTRSTRPRCRCASRRRSTASHRRARRATSWSTPAPRRWRTPSRPRCSTACKHRRRSRRRLHRLVRGRLPRPHAGQPRRHPPQEGAARIPDLRLAARLVPGRWTASAQGDRAPRGAELEAALGPARLGPPARRGEEQGGVPARAGGDRRVPGDSRARTCAAFVARAARAAAAPDTLQRAPARRGGAGRADPGRGRRADDERRVHAAPAAAHADLRRAAACSTRCRPAGAPPDACGRTSCFDLPLPPDVVIWAKKAQNGVLFVSEELATFFQEEKKFNTTWEGRLRSAWCACSPMLDRSTWSRCGAPGQRARAGLEALARDYSGLIQNVRGAGVMLAFDVARADWRDALRDRAFRRGLDPAAGRRAHAALLSALRHRALRHRRGAGDPAPRGRGHAARPRRAAGRARAPRSASARSSARSRRSK